MQLTVYLAFTFIYLSKADDGEFRYWEVLNKLKLHFSLLLISFLLFQFSASVKNAIFPVIRFTTKGSTSPHPPPLKGRTNCTFTWGIMSNARENDFQNIQVCEVCSLGCEIIAHGWVYSDVAHCNRRLGQCSSIIFHWIQWVELWNIFSTKFFITMILNILLIE